MTSLKTKLTVNLSKASNESNKDLGDGEAAGQGLMVSAELLRVKTCRICGYRMESKCYKPCSH